jgi:hypothetical protein
MMKFLPASAFAVCLLVACGKQESAPTAAAPAPAKTEPAPEPKAAEPTAAPAPAATAAAAPAGDFGDFGTDDPIERPDMPTRGVLTFLPKDGVMNMMDHWAQFDWKFKATRPGHYQVRLGYELDHASLGVQFKLGETRLRKTITASPIGRKTYLGEIYIAEPGDQFFAIYAPSSANSAGFDLKSVELLPTHEGESTLEQAADGSVTLLAKDATTWSTTMRYESKPEKNCLGYWTDPEDFAEWEFKLAKPGRYQVVVSHGCSADNQGSEVAVKVGSEEKKFTVKDTGGFQKWQDVVVGEIEIKQPGVQRLVVDPVNKAKSAVLDVQKVVLKPVS